MIAVSMLDEAQREAFSEERDRSLLGRIKEIVPWKGDDIKEIIRKTVFIAAVGVLIYSAYDAYIYNFGSKTMIDDQQNLVNMFTGPTVTDTAEPSGDTTAPTPAADGDNPDLPAQAPAENVPASKYPAGMLQNFEQLYDINPDIVGWVSIPGIYLSDTDGTLAINYPVVQNGDNDYYLSHDFFGVEQDYGALYVDYRAKVAGEDRSSNVTIYGHNMKTEYYFHHLRDYNRLSPTFVSEHRIVDFSTLYDNEEYIIFAAFLVSVHEEDDNQPIFRYHNCVEFNDMASFDYWYKNVMYRNYWKTDIDCTIDDEYLTLSTCAFEISDSRFVVVARKLRPGEDPESYTYRQNGKRHMPEKWYRANGYDVPHDSGPDYEFYIPE